MRFWTAIFLLVFTAAQAQDLFRHQTLLASTVPANGDQNPYAVVVAPVSSGLVHQGDVLVDNFNDSANLQGTGTTIVDISPGGGSFVLATVPRVLPGCPGGVGLDAAMAMLSSGWILVGSAPSTDGTAGTRGAGCIIILNSYGRVTGTVAGAKIDDPWGNIAVIDRGAAAVLFVSNIGFGIGAPGQAAPHRATILRLTLAIPSGAPPRVTAETVIGSGFAAAPDAGAFLIGPTGLALGRDGALYVSDALGNRITAIADAAARTTSAGTGRVVTAGGMLNRPLALAAAPDGALLAVNGLDGRAVALNPATGRQLAAFWLDGDAAQTPPGNGDLFGIAMQPNGRGIYYVEDDMNTLMVAQ